MKCDQIDHYLYNFLETQNIKFFIYLQNNKLH